MTAAQQFITATVPGPWAVDNRSPNEWAIVHTGNGRRRVVGPAGRMGRGSNRTNFFEKAMSLANDRNRIQALKGKQT